MLSRPDKPDKDRQQIDQADAAIEEITLALRHEFIRLGGLLLDDENWRAVQQLDEREARGEPLEAVAAGQLRSALLRRLIANKCFVARVKLFDALIALQAVPAEAVQVGLAASAPTPSLNPVSESGPPACQPPAFRTNVKIKASTAMINGVAVGSAAAMVAAASASALMDDVPARPATAEDGDTVADAQDLLAAGTAAMTGAASSETIEPLEAAGLMVVAGADTPAAEVDEADETGKADETGEAQEAAAAQGDARKTAAGTAAVSGGDGQTASEPDDQGIAGLRQIAAWRRQDILWAHRVALPEGDSLPASLISMLGRHEAGANLLDKIAAQAAGADAASGSAAAVSLQPASAQPAAAPLTCAGETTGRGPAPMHWIKGLDQDLAQQLEALGVVGGKGCGPGWFAQISQWTAADVARIKAALPVGRRPSVENWIEQAAVLAGGRTTRYAAKVKAGETCALIGLPGELVAGVSAGMVDRLSLQPSRSSPAGSPAPPPAPDAAQPARPANSAAVNSSPCKTALKKPKVVPPSTGSENGLGHMEGVPSRRPGPLPERPQQIPPVFERSTIVGPRAASRDRLPIAGLHSAFTPGRRRGTLKAAPASCATSAREPAGGHDDEGQGVRAKPVGASIAAEPEHVARGKFEEEAEVVILAKAKAKAKAGAGTGAGTAAGKASSGQSDAAMTGTGDEDTAERDTARVPAPGRMTPRPRARQNPIESHAAYPMQTDEASVVIVQRNADNAAKKSRDLPLQKQNEHRLREGTIRRFLKALSGD